MQSMKTVAPALKKMAARAGRTLVTMGFVFLSTGTFAQATRADLQKVCLGTKQTLSTFPQRAAAPMPGLALARWLDVVDSEVPAYCACEAEGLAAGVANSDGARTPKREQELMAGIRSTILRCKLPRLKASYAASCPLVVKEWNDDAGRPAADPTAVAKLCECAQPTIDALTEDALEGFSNESVLDYMAYRKTGQMPPESQSLVGALSRCGIAELKPAR